MPSEGGSDCRSSWSAPGGYRAGDLIAKRYRLVRLVGTGGMGAVWVAENTALDLPVALKLLLTDRSEMDQAVRRLREEARAAARLGHPGIVRMLDFGQTETGEPFMVMELLHGETLSELLRRERRLPAIDAVRLLLPVADALSAAHRIKLVHRDLKPENIVLARECDGRVQPKLVDFGVATFEREAGRPGAAATDGYGAGSLEYMSPEQLFDQEVDHRSDVWSFAVVLYQATTGTLPFAGDTPCHVLRAITEQPAVPIYERCAGDAALWSVVMRGLEKDRERRWPTMRQFGEELALWLLQHDVHEDIRGTSLCSTWLVGRESRDVELRLASSAVAMVPFSSRPSLLRRHQSTLSTPVLPPPSASGLRPISLRDESNPGVSPGAERAATVHSGTRLESQRREGLRSWWRRLRSVLGLLVIAGAAVSSSPAGSRSGQ